MSRNFIGIDPGSKTSGIIVIDEKGIREGYNVPNDNVVEFVRNETLLCSNLTVVIEDVRPYKMQITDGIIQTIKFLGEIEYRLSQFVKFTLIPRWEVKQWVFIQFKTLALPAIEKKIDVSITNRIKKGLEVKYKQQPTFVYVDDRIVANAMRKWWGIKNPTKVGQRAMYNLKDHSWQALGLVSYHIALNGLKMPFPLPSNKI